MNSFEMVLLSDVGAPHEFLLQVLNERVTVVADDELAVACLFNCDCSLLVTTFVAPVNGYQVVAAAAAHAYLDGCVVVYHNGACAEAVRCNGGEREHGCLGGNYWASYAQ